MSAPLTLLQAIGQILRPTLLAHGPIQLQETSETSTCAPITLHKAGQAVVIKPDTAAPMLCPTCRAPMPTAAADRIFGVFDTQQPGVTRVCVYIIFYQEKGAGEPPLFVFLCELKSKHIAGAGKQAENGRLLADFIIAMAVHHRPVGLPGQIYYRGLIFSTKYAPAPKGKLLTTKCTYQAVSTRMPDLGFAYFPCGASYPMSHFCA